MDGQTVQGVQRLALVTAGIGIQLSPPIKKNSAAGDQILAKLDKQPDTVLSACIGVNK